VLHQDLAKLLIWLIPNPSDCAIAAEELRLSHPNLSDADRARLAVKESRKWAASIGGATGLAANPITMLPAVLADAAAMLKLEGNLAGTIAALLDPDSLADKETFRREIIRSVFPGAISQALRKLGIKAGENVTKAVIRKALSREVTKEIGERAIKFLGIRLSEKAIATKTIPLVGAGIGAAWNWIEIQAVGKRAIEYHLGLEPPASRMRKKVTSFVRDQSQKLRRKPRDP
jgi:hypothetical protein